MRTPRFVLALLAGLAAAGAQPAPVHAKAPLEAAAQAKRIEEAGAFIAAKRPADAIRVLDQVIAEHERAYAGERRQIFSAATPAQAIAYAGMGAQAKRDTVVLGPEWSLAIFLKGFALIDLGKQEEARPFLERALALSPLDAQFNGELGEWHKNKRAWSEAYALFEKAVAGAELLNGDDKSFHKRRGLRGMGFVLIEQGKLDEAEKLFQQCLQIDPNDAAARNELDYIQEQREKTAHTT